jgi:glutathione S-transferase
MLTLYSTPLSSPSNKVVYVLNYLGADYEVQKLNLRQGDQRKPEFLKINPYGKVPAIEDNGFTLSESNAIIRYLADKHQSDVYPRDLQQRAIVDQWIDFVAQHVAIPVSKIMFNTYYYKWKGIPKDENSFHDGHTFLKHNLPAVEQQLQQHTYLAGNSLTLADFCLLAALDSAEVLSLDLSLYPATVKWQQTLMKSAFYTQCHESFTLIFNKVLEAMAAAK